MSNIHKPSGEESIVSSFIAKLEELNELLPKGTRLQVEKQVIYDGIKTTPPTETLTATVESVTTSLLTEEPLIETTSGAFLKEWFMLAE